MDQQIDQFPSGTELDVIRDITGRQRRGFSKYGTTVARNPLELRAWLQHAYEEALDQAIYLRRAIAQCNWLIAHEDDPQARMIGDLPVPPPPDPPTTLREHE